MRRAVFVLVIVLIVAIVGVGAYAFLFRGSSEGSGPAKVITDQNIIAKTTLGFVQLPYKDDYGVTRLSGYFDNLGKTTIQTADIEIQLFDSDGNRKELVKYQVHDIKPQTRKSFDANAGALQDSRTATIKVARIEVIEP